MSERKIDIEKYKEMYEECRNMIPFLASEKFIREGDECYCVWDMELFTQCCVSWKEALAASLEHSVVYNNVFTKIQTAI